MLKVKIEPITGFGKTAEFATVSVMHYDLANGTASATVTLYEVNPFPAAMPSATAAQIMNKHISFTQEELSTWGTDDMVFVDLALAKMGVVRDADWTEPAPEPVTPPAPDPTPTPEQP